MERLDIPNASNPQFEFLAPNQSGAVTSLASGLRENGIVWLLHRFFVRAGGWVGHCRKAGRRDFKALDTAYEQCGRPQGLLFHSDKGWQYANRMFR